MGKNPIYELTLGKSYYEKGFFNLGVAVDRYIGAHGTDVRIILGPGTRFVDARIDRNANQNGTPRIHVGARLRDYFYTNFHVGDVVNVIILDPQKFRILRP